VERNALQESVQVKRQAFDAWRQVVEIVLTACPEDLLTGEARRSAIFELLQDLLTKVVIYFYTGGTFKQYTSRF